jgi:hypothetical protein
MAALLFDKELSANGIILLTVIGYPTSESDGTYEWKITEARGGRSLAVGRGTLAEIGNAALLPVERLSYHALLAGLQALLAENYVGSLTIAAGPAFIALLRQSNHPGEPDLQRLRRHAVQLLKEVRGELTLQEQLVVPPLMVAEPEPPPRAAKPLPPRVVALVTQLNANPAIVTDEDPERLQIRGTDTFSRIRLPELLPLVEKGDRRADPGGVSRRTRITGRCPALAPARPEFRPRRS